MVVAWPESKCGKRRCDFDNNARHQPDLGSLGNGQETYMWLTSSRTALVMVMRVWKLSYLSPSPSNVDHKTPTLSRHCIPGLSLPYLVILIPLPLTNHSRASVLFTYLQLNHLFITFHE